MYQYLGIVFNKKSCCVDLFFVISINIMNNLLDKVKNSNISMSIALEKDKTHRKIDKNALKVLEITSKEAQADGLTIAERMQFVRGWALFKKVANDDAAGLLLKFSNLPPSLQKLALQNMKRKRMYENWSKGNVTLGDFYSIAEDKPKKDNIKTINKQTIKTINK